MAKKALLTGLSVLLAFATAGPLWAQSTASLQGTVTDAQGAVVPGASVTASNQATGVLRSALTDSAGYYQMAALPVGTYQVEARLTGFQPRVLKGIALEVARTAVVNVQLSVSTVSEVVAVTAEAPSIDTATTSVGQVINQRTVQDIPLNGRHFVDLGLLIPGSVAPPQNGFLSAPLRGQGSFAFNTAGAREDTVNFMINGVNLNDMAQNQITFQPSINTVQEFKVDNSTFSAQYGRNSGAIVNIATRSGSNDLHGEVFEFLRNQRFDSRNRFATAKSPFNRNQFGANLGGPLVKSRTFFFVTYEGLRQRQGLDLNSGVLTDAERARVTDPVSQKLLSLIPEPNAVGSRGEGRFIGSASANVNIDQGTGDLSHQISNGDNLHAYYAFQRDQRVEPNLQGNTIPGFGDTRHSHRMIGTVNEVHTFSPSTVNELRFGFNKINITFQPNAELNPADFGISDGVTSTIGIPQITVGGIALNFGGPSNFPQGRIDTSYVLSDTLTHLQGRHSLKFGGEYRRFKNHNFTSDTGTFSYATLADFQAGTGNAFNITLGDRPSDIVQQALGAFVEDTFKVNSALTLELGLRWDSFLAPTDEQDRFVVFDPVKVALERVGAGIDHPYGTSNDLEPRVGLVWDPFKNGKTIVRAAYAILADQPVTNAISPTSANPPLAVPLNISGPVRLDNAVAAARAVGLAPNTIDADFRGARSQSFNLNLQREMPGGIGMMIGYFGSRGDHLRLTRNLNQFINGVRPYPRLSADSPISAGATLGNITDISSSGKSWYNAMWVTANKRLARGLQFNASYTLSKSEDYNSLNSSAQVIQDAYNPADSKGPSDYDARHRFVLNAIYELPFKGNRFAEGWQIGVISQGQTGNPINILTNINTFTGVATLRPDLVGDLHVIGNSNQWFSSAVCDPRIAGSCTASSVFALPVSASGVFHFGNLPRNAIYGPSFYTTDLSLVKNTKMGGATLQVRAEVFDLFNHANLGQPGRIALVGSTAFGVITNTRFPTGDSGSSRQIQFAAKLLF
jgi:Carboxypeptidase regulatory-like domain